MERKVELINDKIKSLSKRKNISIDDVTDEMIMFELADEIERLEILINKKDRIIAAKNLTLSGMELKVNNNLEKMKCQGVHCKGTGIAEYCEYCMEIASESNPNS